MKRQELERQELERQELERQELKRQELKRPDLNRPEWERQEVRSSGRAWLEGTTVNMCCPRPQGQASSRIDDPTESFG